jgi:predicted amidohydrolase
MRICAVQYRPITGDIAANIARHLSVIELAVAEGVDLIFFPELSLSGYEPLLAKNLATEGSDSRLDMFQRRSDTGDIWIGVGLPLAAESGVQIGMVWFTPNGPRRVYAKQQLHADEFPFFVPGHGQLLLEVKGLSLAPAICFESLQHAHAEHAANLGADVYLASVAKPARGIGRAVVHYPDIARKHHLHVLMANGVGPSEDFVSAGQSAAWNHCGEILAQMDDESEGMVTLDTATGEASGRAIPWNVTIQNLS